MKSIEYHLQYRTSILTTPIQSKEQTCLNELRRSSVTIPRANRGLSHWENCKGHPTLFSPCLRPASFPSKLLRADAMSQVRLRLNPPTMIPSSCSELVRYTVWHTGSSNKIVSVSHLLPILVLLVKSLLESDIGLPFWHTLVGSVIVHLPRICTPGNEIPLCVTVSVIARLPIKSSPYTG